MGLYLFVVITEVHVGCLSDKIIRSTTSIHVFHCLPHLSLPPYFPVFSSFHPSQSVRIDAGVHSVDIIFPANSYLPWPDIRNYIIPVASPCLSLTCCDSSILLSCSLRLLDCQLEVCLLAHRTVKAQWSEVRSL